MRLRLSIVRVGRGLRAFDRALQTSVVVLAALWVVGLGGEDVGVIAEVPFWLPGLFVAVLLASVTVGMWVRHRKTELHGEARAPESAGFPLGTLKSRSIAVAASIAAALVAVSVGGWLWFQSALPMTMAIISILGALVLDAFLRVCRFPPVVYGGVALSQTDIRRFWIVFLLFAFGLAAEGFSSSTFSRSEAWSARAEPTYLPNGARSWSQAKGILFYRREAREEVTEEGLHAGSVREEIQVPWVFLGGALLYVLLVMAWEPRAPRVGAEEKP